MEQSCKIILDYMRDNDFTVKNANAGKCIGLVARCLTCFLKKKIKWELSPVERCDRKAIFVDWITFHIFVWKLWQRGYQGNKYRSFTEV